MRLRSIAALLLGLVLQMILVIPAGAWAAAGRCEMQDRPCCCCEAEQSCPCITGSGESDEAPAPLAPPERPLQVDAVVPSGLPDIAPAAHHVQTRVLSPPACRMALAGFRGVDLPVAFCCLVI